jgi:hypothetical protein
MPNARIFRPARTAMQQGRAKTGDWTLEFEPARALQPDSLMGWAGGGDTTRQVRLRFPTLEAAKAYADKHAIAYAVEAEHDRVVKPKSYADNFRWDQNG